MSAFLQAGIRRSEATLQAVYWCPQMFETGFQRDRWKSVSVWRNSVSGFWNRSAVWKCRWKMGAEKEKIQSVVSRRISTGVIFLWTSPVWGMGRRFFLSFISDTSSSIAS